MSACWIVHDGAIRIEWLSLKGTTEVETIGGHDVETIDVESGGRKDSLYVITIRLRTGTKSAVRRWPARIKPAPCRLRSSGDWD